MFSTTKDTKLTKVTTTTNSFFRHNDQDNKTNIDITHSNIIQTYI